MKKSYFVAMKFSEQIAKHFNDVFLGGNWTSVNLKDTLADVTWQEATQQINDCNTIATLVNHMAYYVSAVLKVLQGEALNAKDSLSFSHPPIASQQDWDKIQDKIWTEVAAFAVLTEQLTDERFSEYFTDEKYGSYYRNIAGIIEHTHYHLGQIVLLKKIIRAGR